MLHFTRACTVHSAHSIYIIPSMCGGAGTSHIQAQWCHRVDRPMCIAYVRCFLLLSLFFHSFIQFSADFMWFLFTYVLSCYYFFLFLQVPERVRAMNATIKLLLIVREPVTRAISDYTQLRSHAATATLPQQSSPSIASSSIPSSSSSSSASSSLSLSSMAFSPISKYDSSHEIISILPKNLLIDGLLFQFKEHSRN